MKSLGIPFHPCTQYTFAHLSFLEVIAGTLLFLLCEPFFQSINTPILFELTQGAGAKLRSGSSVQFKQLRPQFWVVLA